TEMNTEQELRQAVDAENLARASQADQDEDLKARGRQLLDEERERRRANEERVRREEIEARDAPLAEQAEQRRQRAAEEQEREAQERPARIRELAQPKFAFQPFVPMAAPGAEEMYAKRQAMRLERYKMLLSGEIASMRDAMNRSIELAKLLGSDCTEL